MALVTSWAPSSPAIDLETMITPLAPTPVPAPGAEESGCSTPAQNAHALAVADVLIVRSEID